VPTPRYLFVLGTGRCGSTLVADLLAAHPDIGWISSYPEPLGRVARTAGMKPNPSEAYALLREQVSPMLVDPCRDLTAEDAAPWLEQRLRDFFDRRALQQGRPVFMHKFTGWPRARLLAAVFPEAKFVHVVRDGRSVANSLLQVRWWRGYHGVPGWSFGDLSEQERGDWEAAGQSWAYLAGLEWKRLMEAFASAKEEIEPDRWLDLRYEDFVARPREQLTAVLRLVGLDRWDGLERIVARFGVSQGRKEAYRDELRPEDVALLEPLLASTLARWGYSSTALGSEREASGVSLRPEP
jgi:Sulfotransferase family